MTLWRNKPAAALCIGVTALLCSCKREQRAFNPQTSLAEPVQLVRLSDVQAGGSSLDNVKSSAKPPRDKPPRDYEENAYSISEGKRLYSYFNCVGCHAHGGGGSGPALMDAKWRYGHKPIEI